MAEIHPSFTMVNEVLQGKFAMHPRRSIAAANSGHGVIFGEYDGIEVAAKPFRGDRSFEKASYEERMTHLVSSMGFITLNPLEVVNGDGIAILLTSYEYGLVGGNALSLDAHPSSEAGQRVSRAMASIAVTLGRLHRENLTHGDPKTKNFGFEIIENAEQEPFIFDLEKAAAHGKNSPFIEGALKRDLRSFTYSLAIRGYGGKCEEEGVDYLIDTVLEPYADTLSGSLPGASRVLPLLDAAVDNYRYTQLRATSNRQNKSKHMVSS